MVKFMCIQSVWRFLLNKQDVPTYPSLINSVQTVECQLKLEQYVFAFHLERRLVLKPISFGILVTASEINKK